MRNLTEEMAEAREAALLARVRAVVREEIGLAFGALARSADKADIAYDTPEIESRVYSGVQTVAEAALQDIRLCWTEGHLHEEWGQVYETCRRCRAPQPNPFETKDQTDGTS
jgi:hypothetical protein